MTCAYGPEAAVQHSQEIERTANEAQTSGNTEGAKHLFKRGLAYSMWTLGYDNSQTQSIKSQLDKLENPTQSTAPQNASKSSGINSFEDMFKRI